MDHHIETTCGGAVSAAAAAELFRLSDAGGWERGAVFTRVEVVNFILDIAGYTADRPLWQYRFLEPSFGHGDFLVPAIRRLLTSYKGTDPEADLRNAIRGVEIHADSAAETRGRVLRLFRDFGIGVKAAERLARAWIIEGDFLLADLDLRGGFTHVVGNPPYVRQEMIAVGLMAEYRSRYSTIYDRADLYVPFFERSLGLLAEGGVVCFICSDRWMKNKYGAPLRSLISSGFHLAAYVDMVGVPAFDSDVIAYPAITAIVRARGETTRLAFRPELDPARLASISAAIRGEAADSAVTEMRGLDAGPAPWLLHEPDMTGLIRRLEARFPTLEEADCQVGIGVATGADRAYIAPFDEMDVEPDRKLPLVTTKDIRGGTVEWRGLGIVNPFADDGSLVSLADYPKLAVWFDRHSDVVRKRNVARRRPDAWYRTIDRITPSLAAREKLLIPDIKGSAHVVFENGRLYPHHNLYYIVSDRWDLKALQAVLMSGIAHLFVSAYSVKMAGGHLRFQAQYLRRIRLPEWESVHVTMRDALLAAVAAGDEGLARSVVYDIYGLTEEERMLLHRTDEDDGAESRGLRKPCTGGRKRILGQ